MQRVLMVHPSLQPPGGGNCVAAWVVEALRDRCELTLLAWKDADLDQVNRYFGTSLEPSDFSLRLIPSALRLLVDALPTPTALLSLSLMARVAQRLLQRQDWDVVLGTNNEMDFGRRGIQYVHFPYNYLPRPDCDLRWYHRAFPLATRGYQRLCRRIAGGSNAGVARNLTLVNSDWTARKYRELYGADAVTVYPPVPGDFPRRPWEEREDGFVCIGRISPEKELEKVIGILARVRQRGRQIRLHLVGSPDHRAFTRRILALAAREGSWIETHLDIPRSELLGLLARNRYGIHGMVGEHFGIVVAELQRAGAIVFVADDGGQVEIVGGDARQIYAGADDAVEKIDRVLTDPDLRASLRARVAERRDRFTAERFMAEIRDAVATFTAS